MRWDDPMNAHDSEEHDDEVNDMPSFHHGSGAKGDRVIRRRSSKACDNCRKSKASLSVVLLVLGLMLMCV